MAPRQFDSTNAWYEQTWNMQASDPVADGATITPSRVEAAEAPREWRAEYTVHDQPLRAGAHVALEIPLHFRLDHGRPYPVGTTHVRPIDDASPGYAAPVDVRSPSDQVVLEFDVSNTSRFSVLDIEVAEGVVGTGETIAITLGDRRGSRLRAPSFSQRFRFACGVDHGDGSYRGVADPPVVDVTGASADSFRVIAPSTVDGDEPFTVTIYPADEYNHNPARDYGGTADVDAPSFVDAPETLGFDVGDPEPRDREALLNDTFTFDVATEGSGRGTVTAVDRRQGLIGRSNPIATDWSDRDVYWGEIHAQGYDSIGVGTPAEMFEWGRNVEGLDFCATANHYGGRYDVTPEVWNRIVEASNEYYDPGEFVTFVSYEWGGSAAYGHRNVYYRGDEGRFFSSPENSSHYEPAATLEELWERLDAYGEDAIAFPHHSKFCGTGRTNWDVFDDEYQRLVEIYSAWGNSEEGGPHSVRSGLRKGHRVGFTAGTDTHEGQPGNGPHEFGEGSGLTAVYADALTREDVFDALFERRTYATTGARLLLDYECNGLPMGAETDARDGGWSTRTLSIRAIGTDDVAAVDVIRNGEVVGTLEPDGRAVDVEWTDETPLDDVLRDTDHPDGRDAAFYYVRLRQRDGEIAWASPVWFLA